MNGATPELLAQAEALARSWSVGGLMLAVSDALQARLGSVAVRGELSSFTRAASGHCYFTLKDADGASAMLRCAMFRRAAGLMDFRPADGQQVLLRGRITVYEARGDLQCVVESMQRLGAGSLYELFLQQRARLAAAGLFDADRKRPLPRFPRRIGIVTSLGAAALHDVITAIARRAPQVQLIVYPSLVQGPQAPAQLCDAIELANRRREVDLLLVCRGGGSLEDLWAFNDEQVVRALAASALPVVCGVGHETDVTLAELAADLRAPTPTAAAELATPVQAHELQRLDELARALRRGVHRRLDQQAQRVDRLTLQLGRPARRLSDAAARLDRLGHRLVQAGGRAMDARQARLPLLAQRLQQAAGQHRSRADETLARLALRLSAVDPQRVLQRGYAWLSASDGRPVTRAVDVRVGDALVARWADGEAGVTVRSVTGGPSGSAPAGPAAAPGRPRRAAAAAKSAAEAAEATKAQPRPQRRRRAAAPDDPPTSSGNP